jgi:ATP-dependent Clp protease adaptor protein ClpS
LSIFAAAGAVAFARLSISSLPVAWFVLAVNAAFILRFAAARARASDAPPQKPIDLAPDLKALMQSAQAEAGKREHRHLTLEHLLLVMSRDPEIATLLRACDADPAELTRELEDYLALLSPEAAPDGSQLFHAFQRAAMVAARAGREQISTQSVLVQIRRDPDAYASLLLRAAGIELVDLLRCIAHGKPDVRPHPLSGVTRAALRMHNDDYTTMEFVVDALMRFFHKSQAESTHIMLTVHKKGSAVAGVYTRDVAETKVEEVMKHARESGMPLLVTAETE